MSGRLLLECSQWVGLKQWRRLRPASRTQVRRRGTIPIPLLYPLFNFSISILIPRWYELLMESRLCFDRWGAFLGRVDRQYTVRRPWALHCGTSTYLKKPSAIPVYCFSLRLGSGRLGGPAANAPFRSNQIISRRWCQRSGTCKILP